MQRFGKKGWKYVPILMSFLLILMIGFQNCQDQRNIINIASNSTPSTNRNTVELLFLPEEVSNEEIRVLSDHFAVDTSVTFVLKALEGQETAFEIYDNFEWSISLHEDLGNVEATLINQDDTKRITSQTNYEWSFNEIGVYAILATLTSSGEEPSLDISRSIVIGQCANSPLEINININNVQSSQTEGSSTSTSTSLPLNETSFYVDRSDGQTVNISNGLWEVRFNGHKVESSFFNIEQYTQLTMVGVNVVEGDIITVEFFTQLEGDNCITYSKGSYKMTDGNLSPLDEVLTTVTTTVTVSAE